MSETQKMHFQQAGTGEPILLIHGLFGSLENLGMVRRGLESHFNVVSVDLPDHGSSCRTEQFSFETYAEKILAVMDELAIDKAHIMGHSLGGKVAMYIALHYPHRVNKLIIADIAPVAYPPRHTNVMQGLNAVSLETIEHRKQADQQMAAHVKELGVRQFLLKSLTNDEGQWQWRFNLPLLQRDYPLLSGAIDADSPFNQPTLFIKGGNSDYLLPEHKPHIARLFPNSKARIIAQTGHWLHAEKPDTFNKVVLDFVNKLVT